MITVLTGDNSYQITQEMKRLSTEFAGQVEYFEGDDVSREQLSDLLMGATLFATERLIIIRQLSNNKAVFSTIEGYLDGVPDTTHLVLVEPTLDKRTRVYKWLQKSAKIIEHKMLSDRELMNWLAVYARDHKIELSDDVKRLLLTRVGTDQWSLSQAVNKLALANQAITSELVIDLIEATPQAAVFDLLDAIMARQQADVWKLLRGVMQIEEPYKFLGLLSSQVFALVAIKAASGVSNRQIASDIGIHPFVVEKLQPIARRIDESQLSTMIDALKNADIKLKSSGAQPWLIIELAVGKMVASS